MFLSTMIDLYALPDDFPGREAARSERDPYGASRRWNLSWQGHRDRRLVPHLQLHEFEAMLLVKPDAILMYYNDLAKEVRL